MSANKLIRGPLWATLLAALVAAMVVFFVFVPNGEAAPAADEPTYEPQIINGEPVPNGKYPFMSLLTLTFTDSPDPGHKPDIFRCDGSLIDADSVLSAAHCVTPETPSQRLLAVKVRVGMTVRSSNQGQVRFATKASVHPKYDPRPETGMTSPYDAAVLQLNRKVSNIKPIELATSSQNNLERPGRHATIAGWGNTRPNAKPGKEIFPDRMQEAQVPIVSDSRADKAWEKEDIRIGRNADFVPPLMIGAGGKQSITCQGDSGGPLFVRTSANGDGDNGDDENSRNTNGDDENGAKYTQIGITSFGPIGCLAGSRIAVYTEVNAKPIASFIERTADNGDGDGD
jgi:secreted trypsin-like serine protease